MLSQPCQRAPLELVVLAFVALVSIHAPAWGGDFGELKVARSFSSPIPDRSQDFLASGVH